MKLTCFIFLLAVALIRLLDKACSPCKETDEAKVAAISFGIIIGFILQVSAIWYLSGYTLQ